MNEWIITRINSLKEDLSNTINDLLVMKKLKTEIEQLELMLQMNDIFTGKNT